MDTWKGGVPDRTLALNLTTGGFLPESIWINQFSSSCKSLLYSETILIITRFLSAQCRGEKRQLTLNLQLHYYYWQELEMP